MIAWEYPWYCFVCQNEFEAGKDGASCSRCHKPMCLSHLSMQYSGSDSEMVCQTCCDANEAFDPVSSIQLAKWYFKQI